MSTATTYDLIMKIALVLEDGDQQVLHEYGLNTTQYAALQLLNPHEGQRLVDLATAILCERSTITRIVDHFEKEGVAQREDDPDDRRTQRVTLTSAGVKLQRRSREAHEQSVRRRMGALSLKDQRQISVTLESLLTSLKTDLADFKQ